MPKNEVFANGLEVACQSAEGKSVACFPDPCWSPPAPPAGPVVIPYPNTAFAKDLTNGSKTVFISGKPIAQKNKSYFKTSTGNEAATRAFPMGVVTHTIKGKAYFASWSMDVKVEGLNVCRHLDLMTHNHGSVPGNTGPWMYLDTRDEKHACKRDKKRLDRKCKPTKKQGRGKKAKKVPDTSKGAWKKSYCRGLQFKPPSADDYDPEKMKAEFDKLIDVKQHLETVLQSAKEILVEKAKEWALKKAGKVLAKSAIKGWLGPIGWVWTAYDVVSTGLEIKDMWNVIDDMQKDIDELRKLPEKLEQIKERGLTPATMADAQALIAKANPCLRARKCMLVPYKDDYKSKKKNNNRGCCPGQTLHHVIPKSQFKDSECPKYNPKKAPCVCVEGTSHSRGGSHQALHDVLEPKIKEAADTQGEMTYRQAKTNAISAYEEVFGQCNKACIAAQLDNYHKKVCGQNEDFKVRSVSAKTSKVYKAPSPATENF